MTNKELRVLFSIVDGLQDLTFNQQEMARKSFGRAKQLLLEMIEEKEKYIVYEWYCEKCGCFTKAIAPYVKDLYGENHGKLTLCPKCYEMENKNGN